MPRKLKGDLENPEIWDFEHAETKEPIKAPRVVVSVAFKNSDFLIVSKYAKRLGKRTSEFIRDAATETATGGGSKVNGFCSTGSVWLGILPTISRAHTTDIKQEMDERFCVV